MPVFLFFILALKCVSSAAQTIYLPMIPGGQTRPVQSPSLCHLDALDDIGIDLAIDKDALSLAIAAGNNNVERVSNIVMDEGTFGRS